MPKVEVDFLYWAMSRIILPMEVSTLKLVRNVLIVAALALPVSLAQAADVKIGFVSIAKILNSAPRPMRPASDWKRNSRHGRKAWMMR